MKTFDEIMDDLAVHQAQQSFNKQTRELRRALRDYEKPVLEFHADDVSPQVRKFRETPTPFPWGCR